METLLFFRESYSLTQIKIWAHRHKVTHFAYWFHPLFPSAIETIPLDLLETRGFFSEGYAVVDATFFPFIKEGILYIPATFFSHTGEVRDLKTPLLRSEESLCKALERMGQVSAGSLAENGVKMVEAVDYCMLEERKLKYWYWSLGGAFSSLVKKAIMRALSEHVGLLAASGGAKVEVVVSDERVCFTFAPSLTYYAFPMAIFNAIVAESCHLLLDEGEKMRETKTVFVSGEVDLASLVQKKSVAVLRGILTEEECQYFYKAALRAYIIKTEEEIGRLLKKVNNNTREEVQNLLEKCGDLGLEAKAEVLKNCLMYKIKASG